MTRFDQPVVASAAPDDPARPLVVLLHGRGADEVGIMGLTDHLPDGPSYAVRAPIAEGGGYAWFANRGIGRPVTESLAATMAWFRSWSTMSHPRGDRWSSSGSAAGPRSPAGWCCPIQTGSPAPQSCTGPCRSTRVSR